MAPELTDEELDFLGRTFDLARSGKGAELIEVVHAGVPVNLTNAAGDTLLLLAAYHDHPDVVVSLLAEGADSARVNDRGQTALAAAVFRRSFASVIALLEAGADPQLGLRSAAAIAEFFGLAEMVELLARSGAGPEGPSTEYPGANLSA